MAHASKARDFETGHQMKVSRVDRLVEQRTHAWVERPFLYRKLSLAETVAARSEDARQKGLEAEILTSHEVEGCHFQQPNGSTYRFPREPYEEIDKPLGVRVCRYPREAQKFAGACA